MGDPPQRTSPAPAGSDAGDARDHLAAEIQTAFNLVAQLYDVFDHPPMINNRPVQQLVVEPLLAAAEALSVAAAMVREWPPVPVSPSRVDAQPDGWPPLTTTQ